MYIVSNTVSNMNVREKREFNSNHGTCLQNIVVNQIKFAVFYLCVCDMYLLHNALDYFKVKHTIHIIYICVCTYHLYMRVCVCARVRFLGGF